jgi:hypothetical protein
MENEQAARSVGNKAPVDPKKVALETIAFVLKQLPAWRDDPDRPFEQSEPKLNSQLCDFLDSRAKSLLPTVYFKHEELQSGRRSVDLSVKLVESMVLEARAYSIYDPILVLECKRLPAPTKDREKEYVTGGKDRQSGGIQRFKLGLHGANLNLVAMIGYVQERTAREWHHEINQWISELCSGAIEDICIWSDGETLKPLEENFSRGISCCRSVHKRTAGRSSDAIEIHHLWIALNMRQTQERS